MGQILISSNRVSFMCIWTKCLHFENKGNGITHTPEQCRGFCPAGTLKSSVPNNIKDLLFGSFLNYFGLILRLAFSKRWPSWKPTVVACIALILRPWLSPIMSVAVSRKSYDRSFTHVPTTAQSQQLRCFGYSPWVICQSQKQGFTSTWLQACLASYKLGQEATKRNRSLLIRRQVGKTKTRVACLTYNSMW